MPLSFRAATIADVDQIVLLVESAYRGDSSRIGWTTEADFLDGRRTGPDEVGSKIAAPGNQILLAFSDDELLASCHIEKQDYACYFGMFAVKPTLQNSGLGRQVLAQAERVARESWGCTAMKMTVIDIRDTLIAWYERRGYQNTGEILPFPALDPKFGLPKQRLQFVVLRKELVAG
jgi:GNAT superfamily N-acetyltransferase